MAFQWHPLLNTPWKETMESECTKTYFLEFELMKIVSNVNQYCSFSPPPPPFTRLGLAEHKWLFLLTLLRGPFTYLKVICIYTCILHISMHTYTTHAHNWFFDPWIRQTTEDVCCRWHSLPHNHRFLCL